MGRGSQPGQYRARSRSAGHHQGHHHAGRAGAAGHAAVAIEGYGGTTLLGGAAMDVMVPTALPFRMSISGDANGDGDLTVSDIFYEINNLFANGPAPVVGD